MRIKAGTWSGMERDDRLCAISVYSHFSKGFLLAICVGTSVCGVFILYKVGHWGRIEG